MKKSFLAPIFRLAERALDDSLSGDALGNFFNKQLSRAKQAAHENPDRFGDPERQWVLQVNASGGSHSLPIVLTSTLSGEENNAAREIFLSRKLVSSTGIPRGAGADLLYLLDHVDDLPADQARQLDTDLEALLRHVEVKRKKSLRFYPHGNAAETWVEKNRIAYLFCRAAEKRKDWRFLNAALKLNDWAYPYHRRLPVGAQLVSYLQALAEQESVLLALHAQSLATPMQFHPPVDEGSQTRDESAASSQPNTLRVAILAPHQHSLYSRLVAYLSTQQPGIAVTRIIIRSTSDVGRIRGELRRDGARLLREVFQKLIAGEDSLPNAPDENLYSRARAVGLPGKNLQEIAQPLGIPWMMVPDHNRPAVEAALRADAPDVIVFTGGGLMRKKILDIPRLGVLNGHAGWLPAYRGTDVLEWAILEASNQPPQTGISIHFMDQGVDTGPILLRQLLPVHSGDTVAALRSRLETLQVNLMLRTLELLRDGAIAPHAQAGKEGRPYYLMHPRMKQIVEDKLY